MLVISDGIGELKKSGCVPSHQCKRHPVELGRAVCGGSGQEKSQDVLSVRYAVAPNVIPNAPFLMRFICFLLLFKFSFFNIFGEIVTLQLFSNSAFLTCI